MHSKSKNGKCCKSSQSKGEMPKGNTPGTNRSQSLGFSNKHDTSKGEGQHGNKYKASCSVK